jgi:hypothetical protein
VGIVVDEMATRREIRRQDVRRLWCAFEDAVNRGADETIEFLASPAGTRFRAILAGGLVLATPMIMKHPFFRTPVGRVIQIGGAAALLAKAADALRDWEPEPPSARRSADRPGDAAAPTAWT